MSKESRQLARAHLLSHSRARPRLAHCWQDAIAQAVGLTSLAIASHETQPRTETPLTSMNDDPIDPEDLFAEWNGEPDDDSSDDDVSDFIERAEADQMAMTVSLCSATHEGTPCIEVFAHEKDEVGTAPRGKVVLLARMNASELVMFPIVSAHYRPQFLKPKYDDLTSIRIPSRSGDPLPRSISDFDDAISDLPVGFGRHARYGLGLKWEYRLIAETIASVEGVRELVLDDSESPRLNGHQFHLGREQFGDLRRALDTIIARARAKSLEERKNLAFNELLHAADPTKFPEQVRKPKPNEIYELVKVGAGQRRSADVQRAALTVIEQDAAAIARSNPTELMSLMVKIEEVALGELIDRMATMVETDLTEAKWQAFFKANPFVLSIAFPYPLTLIQDQAHVGGSTIRGDGESIADFLFGQRITGSLALIEIKRPSTPLVETKPFRGDLYAPHREAVAALAQVLDQRAQLIENFAVKSRASELRDKHVATVHCIVVAGMAPTDPDRRRSLDLYRNASKDVAIVTFDELLDKLKHVHAVMGRSEDARAEAVGTDADPVSPAAVVAPMDELPF